MSVVTIQREEMSSPSEEKGCQTHHQSKRGLWANYRRPCLKINIQKERKKIVDGNFRKQYTLIDGKYERKDMKSRGKSHVQQKLEGRTL